MARMQNTRLLAEEAHNGLIRFFMTNDVFHFRETSQTRCPRLLAEEAHKGSLASS